LKYFEGLSRCGAVVDRLVAVNIGTRGNAGIVKPQRVCGTGGYPPTSRGLFRSTTS
jgi:hypothetical protein